MLGMTPDIIFDRSTIETSQIRDTSRSGLVNLKAKRLIFPGNMSKQENFYQIVPSLRTISTELNCSICCFQRNSFMRKHAQSPKLPNKIPVPWRAKICCSISRIWKLYLVTISIIFSEARSSSWRWVDYAQWAGPHKRTADFVRGKDHKISIF